jgi:excisionase family DNA binding protein
MWEPFTEHARRIVFSAKDEAARHGESAVSTEHLLLALLLESDCAGVRMLARMGATPNRVRAEMDRRLAATGKRPPEEPSAGEPAQEGEVVLTPRAKRALELAWNEAHRQNTGYAGSEHLLLGILLEGEGPAAGVLAQMGVTIEKVRAELPDTALSMDEAAQYLGTSKPTLYRLLRQGDLKGLKVGKQWRFRKGDLIAYMERNPVAVAAAPAAELDDEIAFYEEEIRRAGAELPEFGEKPSDPSARRTDTLVRQIIALTLRAGGSDIHLEPAREGGETFLRHRQRVDGLLSEMRRLPARLHEPLILRCKQMAGMDLAERRLPQDGRILLSCAGREYDLRCSVIPSLFGEALVMRILDRSSALIGLDRLGISPEDLVRIRALLHQPNGLILVTGPTGSGKTTFLYSCLQETANEHVKTLTIEEPVEYQMPCTTQMQVNRKAGLTFAAGMRAILRQDPDVILVGQLRDYETAELVIEASLTGHLALSTLYANSAVEAVQRFLEMGIAPHLVCATLIGVVSLRLLRKVCPYCMQSYEVREAELRRFGFETDAPERKITLWRGTGCEQCRQTGYKGRTGLFEALTTSNSFCDAVIRGATPAELTGIAAAEGMRTLVDDGLRKALEGITTPEEVMRVTATTL